LKIIIKSTPKFMTQTLTSKLTHLPISPTPSHHSEQLYRHTIVPHPTPASLSVASGLLEVGNFSHAPASIQTDTKTKALGVKLFENSTTFTAAEGNAIFLGGPTIPIADTVGQLTALNITRGNGLGYTADALTSNVIRGLDFYLKPKETFKFDFGGFLNLETQSTTRREKAIAQGQMSIVVYATDACGTTTAIDRLLIGGKQTGNGTDWKVKSSKGFTLNTQTTPLSLSANELSFNGSYSRTFKTATTLTFVATQDTVTNARRNPPSMHPGKPKGRLA
jgi:hypothetical protein